MIKKIINFVLNFILMCLILAIVIIVFINNTILNPNFIKNKFKQNDFYSKTHEAIIKGWKANTMSTGLELEILDDLISVSKVETDINKKLDSLLKEESFEPDTSEIRKELDNRINQTIAGTGMFEISEENKASISRYEDTVEEIYKKEILYNVNYYLDLSILNKILIGCIIAAIVIIIIDVIINRNLMIISILGSSILASGILISSIKFLLKNKILHIVLFDDKFTKFLVDVITEILNSTFTLGLVLSLVGILLIIVGNLKTKTIEKK